MSPEEMRQETQCVHCRKKAKDHGAIPVNDACASFEGPAVYTFDLHRDPMVKKLGAS